MVIIPESGDGLLIRGYLKLYILFALKENSYSGAEIVRKICIENKGHGKPSPGSLYPLLGKMEKNGFIEGKVEILKGRRHKKYTITKQGFVKLNTLKKELLPQMQQAIRMLQNHIDYIYEKENAVE